MRVTFLDDSVRTGQRGGMGKLVAMGGIILDEAELRPLSDDIETIVARYAIPAACELKWSPPPGNWIHDNLVGTARHQCYAELLDAAHARGAQAVTAVIDTGRVTQQGSTALLKAFEFAVERVQMTLERAGHLGIVVADRPGGGADEETRFLRDVLTTIDHGTMFVEARQIVFNAVTTPSHLVRHLQIADLVVGITTAMVGGDIGYAGPIFPHVKQMMLQNANGTIGGTGLKLWPNALRNLYHWALGEDTYWRVSMNAGVTLPWWEWPYFYDGVNQRRQDPDERAAYVASLPAQPPL